MDKKLIHKSLEIKPVFIFLEKKKKYLIYWWTQNTQWHNISCVWICLRDAAAWPYLLLLNCFEELYSSIFNVLPAWMHFAANFNKGEKATTSLLHERELASVQFECRVFLWWSFFLFMPKLKYCKMNIEYASLVVSFIEGWWIKDWDPLSDWTVVRSNTSWPWKLDYKYPYTHPLVAILRWVGPFMASRSRLAGKTADFHHYQW